jgi:hypothetical protein
VSLRSNVTPSGNAQRADDTAGMGLHSPCSPWRSCDSQLNVAHDGRFSALGARRAGLQTTILSAQCEAGVDSQAPLRRTLPTQRLVANEREIGAASTSGLAPGPKSRARSLRGRCRGAAAVACQCTLRQLRGRHQPGPTLPLDPKMHCGTPQRTWLRAGCWQPGLGQWRARRSRGLGGRAPEWLRARGPRRWHSPPCHGPGPGPARAEAKVARNRRARHLAQAATQAGSPGKSVHRSLGTRTRLGHCHWH